MDPSSREVVITPERSRVLHPSGQLYDIQASFEYSQSATSQLQHEISDVTSAPILQQDEPLINNLEEFLEIDDLGGPQPYFESFDNKAVENFLLKETDGLSEFDLFYDAPMPLIDELGPFNQEIVADPCIDILENNTINQSDFQLQYNLDGTGQSDNQTWTHDQRRNGHTSAESTLGSFSLLPSGK